MYLALENLVRWLKVLEWLISSWMISISVFPACRSASISSSPSSYAESSSVYPLLSFFLSSSSPSSSYKSSPSS